MKTELPPPLTTVPETKRTALRSGQGLVEFALIIPILLVLVLGIIDFGRVLTVYAMASNAVRDALRQAEIIGFEPELGSVPPFRDCQLMLDNVRKAMWIPIDLAAGDLTITYYEGTPDRSQGEDADSDTLKVLGQCNLAAPTILPFTGDAADPLENGDILMISLQTDIAFMTPFLSSITPTMPVRFTGQRTIITELELHSDPSIIDTDYDGLDDNWEKTHFGTADPDIVPADLLQTGTDDPDGDGCNNGCEFVRGTDPNNPDSDGDGLTDGEEAYVFFTDPTDTDTDNDTLTDCQEVRADTTRYRMPRPTRRLGTKPTGQVGSEIGCAQIMSYVTNPRVGDTDGDRLMDADELNVHNTSPTNPDTDGDTLSDGEEVLGIPATDTVRYPLIVNLTTYRFPTNPLLTDSDGDGLTDANEVFLHGTNPTALDTDSDGIDDRTELVGYTVSVNGVNVTYTTDPNDSDSDNDGLTDGEERSGWASVVNSVNVHYYPDPHSADADNDGVLDPDEKLALTNPQSSDTDNDGLNDRYEIDTEGQDPRVIDSGDLDEDGLPDAWEDRYFGNNDTNATPEEVALYSGSDDPDSDGCNNICEFRNGLNPNVADTDGDGLLDGEEVVAGPNVDANGIPTTWLFPLDTLPNAVDSDDDGLNDYQEVRVWSTDPRNPDTDGDTVKDGAEVTGYSITVVTSSGTVTRTVSSNPTLLNSDSDGLDDGAEFTRMLDPQAPDTDGDGLNDDVEVTDVGGYGGPVTTDPKHWDTDGDGLSDGFEAAGYTLPHDSATTCRSNPARVDTDSDTLSDGYEYNNSRNPCVKELPLLTITDVTVNESNATATLTITATELAGEFFSVRYRAIQDTSATYPASPGQDFTAVDNRLNFEIVPASQGTMTKTITIPILQDTSDEYDETFIVELYNASSAEIVDSQAVVTIIDDDDPPEVGISFVSASEITQQATLRVSVLTTISGKPITVNYSTANGTATAGSDYTATTGSVTIPAGSASADIVIPVIDDTAQDKDETFTTTITVPANGNATVRSGQGTATATIFDDESVLITIANTTVFERVGTTTTANFTVTLEQELPRTVTLTYRTNNGTATSPSDFTGTTSSQVTIPANTRTFNLPVTIAAAQSSPLETGPTETFQVQLLSASPGLIQSGTATGTATIYNAPQISVNNVSVQEVKGATVTATFTITLTGYTDQAIAITYQTEPGSAFSQTPSASADTDYVSIASTNHTFVASTSQLTQTRTVTVSIPGQAANENDEYFGLRVNVVTASQGYAHPSQVRGIGTIIDDK
jgi:hypothetical protein